MHLLPCSPPAGQLEVAPRTALRADSAHEMWEGFWGVADEVYYARCSRADGSTQWYRIADSSGADAAESVDAADLKRTRVLFFPRGRRRPRKNETMAMFGRPGGRMMLVGTWRRRVRDAAPGSR